MCHWHINIQRSRTHTELYTRLGFSVAGNTQLKLCLFWWLSHISVVFETYIDSDADYVQFKKTCDKSPQEAACTHISIFRFRSRLRFRFIFVLFRVPFRWVFVIELLLKHRLLYYLFRVFSFFLSALWSNFHVFMNEKCPLQTIKYNRWN